MMGRGEQWEADNYIRLNGEAVKNRELVQNITSKLRTINVQFRKVKGHNNDQWNDRADELAVMGRDEVINWPKCSFDVIIPDRVIAFRERAMRDYWTLAEVHNELKKETEEKLPVARDLKVFKGGNSYDGKWTSGHCQLVHKNLPAPIAPAQPRPVVPKSRTAIFGIWDGKKLKPTRPFDVSLISKEERLRIFNECHPIGQEVRYFVSNNKVEEEELRPGQPYSVYPKTFTRSRVAEAKLTDRMEPVRMEARDQVMLPMNSAVPEEIALLQLWNKYIANRCRAPVKRIKWGKHYRANVEIEEGVVSSLEEGDSVEVVVSNKKKQDDRKEVVYTVGDEPLVYRIWVRGDAAIGDVKKTIALAHKGKPVVALSFEGADLADEDPYKDWMLRTGGHQGRFKLRSQSWCK
jgi:hypothetical protein